MGHSAAMRTLFMRLVAQYKSLADDAEHNLWPLIDQWKQLPEGKMKEKLGQLVLDQDYVVKSLQHVIASLESEIKSGHGDPVTVAALALWLGTHASKIVGLHHEAKRLQPQLNLKPPPKIISDEKIQAIIDDPTYPTREAQAKALGFKDPSGLYRRLKKLPKSP